MLLLLLVEPFLPSCIGAKPYFQDLYQKTLTSMTALWGSRSSARQSANAQDIWPQFIPEIVVNFGEHPLWDPCAFGVSIQGQR